jgi:transketolase
VGFAIAEAQLAATYNRPGHDIVDHYTYAIVTDGDLMEGVASEAASLGGHLQLGKLIYLYDDNRISIDGSTDLAFTEERGKRFEAYGWQVLFVADGNDVDAIDAAIGAAKADARPSLIVCRTHIGYGLPTRQDTAKAHGEPPGDEELDGAKRKLGWPVEPSFYVPEDVLAFFRQALERGAALEAEWEARFAAYRAAFPAEAAELERRIAGRLPEGWEQALPVFPADEKGIATRAASGTVLNALAAVLPELTGGSADLAPSNNTFIKGLPAFQKDSRAGRNFHFGVREHGMAAVVNGMALHGGLMPYGATFLTFADYMRGSLRVSARSHIPAICRPDRPAHTPRAANRLPRRTLCGPPWAAPDESAPAPWGHAAVPLPGARPRPFRWHPPGAASPGWE